tara:strand:- start:6838 stop:7479 length:642 start_codon:yes stop_codon:yes gene_type:complete
MATNLDDLPVSGESESNVNIKITEQNQIVDNSVSKLEEQRKNDIQQVISQQAPQPQAPQQQQQSGESMDINSFITGIQNAAANGGLQLPSRDIPQSQNHLTQDSQLKPNYIPDSNTDYIENSYNHNEIINQNKRKETNVNNLDSLYDDIHIPIILAVIYFVFQLPIIKKNTLKYIPSLFSKDGNYNFSGYIVTSIAFASSYYFIIKTLEYLTI